MWDGYLFAYILRWIRKSAEGAAETEGGQRASAIAVQDAARQVVRVCIQLCMASNQRQKRDQSDEGDSRGCEEVDQSTGRLEVFVLFVLCLCDGLFRHSQDRDDLSYAWKHASDSLSCHDCLSITRMSKASRKCKGSVLQHSCCRTCYKHRREHEHEVYWC